MRPLSYINKIQKQANNNTTMSEEETQMSKTARDNPSKPIFPKGGAGQQSRLFAGASDSESANMAVPSSVSQAMGVS